MSLLNVNLGILAYSDGPASNQPNIRLADLKWSLQGMHTDNFQNIPISLAPGQTLQVVNTARSLSYNGSTNFVITQAADKMRITASIGQRTNRAIDPSSVTWQLTQTGPQSSRLTASTGTPDFSGVVAGDSIHITAPFSPFNQGTFTVLSLSPTYLDFQNPVGATELGASAGGVRVFSSGPVQIGDILDLSNPAFAFPNQGTYPVTDVTDQYIEVLNVNGFAQTITGITTGVAVYPYSYKWMCMAVDSKVLVSLNTMSSSDIEVEPPVQGDIVKQPGLFVKRGKVYAVSVTNPGVTPMQGFLILAE